MQESFILILVKEYYVYILGSFTNTLYIGVTNNLKRRVYEHKEKLVPGFTYKYQINRLLYYESYNSIEEAILREKRLKKWKREWKMKMIRELNPELEDLYAEIL